MSLLAKIWPYSRRAPALAPQPQQFHLENFIKSSFQTSEELIVSAGKDSQKNLRRLALSQKQQQEALDSVSIKLDFICENLHKESALNLTSSEVIEIVDDLNRIKRTGQNNENLISMIEQLESKLLGQANMQVIAKNESPYPKQGCVVVGTIEDETLPEGAVKEIIEQGYRSKFGSVVRKAKVVVSRLRISNEVECNGRDN